MAGKCRVKPSSDLLQCRLRLSGCRMNVLGRVLHRINRLLAQLIPAMIPDMPDAGLTTPTFIIPADPELVHASLAAHRPIMRRKHIFLISTCTQAYACSIRQCHHVLLTVHGHGDPSRCLPQAPLYNITSLTDSQKPHHYKEVNIIVGQSQFNC